jgi:orotate phosphoribosyltransferase
MAGDRVGRRIDLLARDRVRLPRDVALRELRHDIVRASYIEGEFNLSGGLRREYYLDKYLFETRPALLRRVARFMGELVPRTTDRLAAPALGAVALGTAVSLELGLPLVIVRPEVEAHPRRALKGELYPGETLTLIEDVIVTGTRALSAVKRIAEAEARVGTVISVLDRDEGARERFGDASINYKYLFEPGDLGIDGGRHS